MNGAELLLILLIAVFLVGPSRLPEYAAKFRTLVIKAREQVQGAQQQLKDELGPAYEDIDWEQLDPRQYDPRRIVRETWAAAEAPLEKQRTAAVPPPQARVIHDPSLPTPFDPDAT